MRNISTLWQHLTLPFACWGQDTSFTCLQAKSFCRAGQGEVIADYLDQHAAVTWLIKWRPEAQWRYDSCGHVTRRLYSAVAVMFAFNYTEAPQEADRRAWWTARQDLLAVYYSLGWRMPPAVHYETN